MTLVTVELVAILAVATILLCLLYALVRVRATTTKEVTATPAPQPHAVGRRRRRAGLSRVSRARGVDGTNGEDGMAMDATHEAAYDHTPPAASSGHVSRKKEANRLAKREARERQEELVRAAHEREQKRLEADEEAAEQEAAELQLRAARQEALAAEKEKKEMEEYAEWKDLIEVEEAGSGEMDESGGVDEEGMLERFCDKVKEGKVVVLEDLGAEFDLRTEMVVDRLVGLLDMGRLNGFFDDRGKFVCVSLEEMEAVARFMKRKGRVGIDELVRESGRLLSL